MADLPPEPHSLGFPRLWAFALFCLSLTAACATRGELAEDYRTATDRSPPRPSRRTVVLFVLDGLSVPATRILLSQNRLPHIRGFFPGDEEPFRLGRAVFPSLTYSNISSILTTRNVDEQPVIGNQIYIHGRFINFESPIERPTLNHLIRPYTVFTRLAAQNRASVSVATYFGDGATAHFSADIGTGIAYESGDFKYVDKALLGSLRDFLLKTAPARWPDFIFVHLVGVDGTSHKSGPLSGKALDYIAGLDDALAPVFAVLSAAERSGDREVTALLTADHGFTSTPIFSNIEPSLRAASPKLRLANQGRLVSLYFPPEWSARTRQGFLSSVRQLPGVALTLLRHGDTIIMESGSGSFEILYQKASCGSQDYALNFRTKELANPQAGQLLISSTETGFLCPEQVDQATFSRDEPYFVTNIASYFHAHDHPDAVVLAKPGVNFNGSLRGQHGGPSAEELLVPIFLRNARLRDTSRAVPTYELLRFLDHLD